MDLAEEDILQLSGSVKRLLAKRLIAIDGRPLKPFKATYDADPMQVRVRRAAWWAIRVGVEVSLEVVAPRAPGRGRGNRARHRDYPISAPTAPLGETRGSRQITSLVVEHA